MRIEKYAFALSVSVALLAPSLPARTCSLHNSSTAPSDITMQFAPEPEPGDDHGGKGKPLASREPEPGDDHGGKGKPLASREPEPGDDRGGKGKPGHAVTAREAEPGDDRGKGREPQPGDDRGGKGKPGHALAARA